MKYLKRIFVFALVMMMLLSVSVFADEQTAPEDTKTEEAASEYVKSMDVDVPVTLNYEEFAHATDKAKEVKMKVADNNAYYHFKAEKTGYVYLCFRSSSKNSKTVNVYFCNYKGKKISTIKSKLKKGKSFYAIVPVENNKNYRIKITGTKKGEAYYMNGALVKGETSRTLMAYENGNLAIATGKKSSKKTYTTYWKTTDVPKGALSIYMADLYSSKLTSAKITLLNSKKKAVSSTVTITGKKDKDGSILLSSATFGVEGGTYYVKVSTKAPIYGIKRKCITSYNDEAAFKRSEAITLEEGKTRSAVLAATGKKTTQYYKVVLNKKKHLKFDIDGYIAPGTKMKITIYDSKGKSIDSLKVKGEVNKIKTVDYGTSKSLKEGTYYIGVGKDSKLTSAAYTITHATSDNSLIKK